MQLHVKSFVRSLSLINYVGLNQIFFEFIQIDGFNQE